MTEFNHYSVLLRESIEGLNIKPDGTYVDCTLGGGGHSYEIAKRLGGKGLLIAIDRDREAIEAAKERLKEFEDRIEYSHSCFSELNGILDGYGIARVDGVIMDLGVSSHQFDTPERGFSYRYDASLDMRMNQESGISAKDVVNAFPEEEIADILWKYGEERYSRKIARNIVRAREKKQISTTFELNDIVRSSIPKGHADGVHPEKRTFQALRIFVNNELDELENTLRIIPGRLNTGGRISVITFHSLEDRIVKNTFKDLSLKCTCPPDFPVCVCNRKPVLKVINTKPILPSETELNENSRSKSAKLRVAERI